MQLVCPVPTIHFKPVEGKRRSTKGEPCMSLSWERIFIASHKFSFTASVQTCRAILSVASYPGHVGVWSGYEAISRSYRGV